MKRFSVFLLLCLLASAGVFAQTRGSTMYVAVKSISLKTGTGIFAGTVRNGTLAYGATVTIRTVNGKWVEVATTTQPTVTGWTQTSNLTSKRITAASGTSASASEIALAGKGFNEEVEGTYKSGNAELDFAGVDAVEANVVQLDDLKQFIVEGHLKGAEEN
jgi:uncharacterized protein YgiM (DUF1202 family)